MAVSCVRSDPLHDRDDTIVHGVLVDDGVEDPSGEHIEVDTRHPEVRRLFAERNADRRSATSKVLKRSGVDELAIRTDEQYAGALRRFFHMRQKRFR